MGTWPDRVQYCGQPVLLPWSKLKRALVQVDSPASYLVGHVHLLWVELEHVEPTEAELEGEGTAGCEDCLGRGGSQAGVPLQAVASCLSLERHGEGRRVREPVTLSGPATTSRGPEHSTA